MKSRILAALATRFEGVESRVLDGIAEKLSKTISDESQIEDAVSSITYMQIIDSYADRRATSASITAVSNYEKKHKLKDGKPIDAENRMNSSQMLSPQSSGDILEHTSMANNLENSKSSAPNQSQLSNAEPPLAQKQSKMEAVSPNPQSQSISQSSQQNHPQGDAVPGYVKELLAQMQKMTEHVNQLDGEMKSLMTNRLINERKSRLDGVISALTEAQRRPYERISLSGMSDVEFDAFLEESKQNVEAIQTEKSKELTRMNRPYAGMQEMAIGKATPQDVDILVSMLN